MMRAQEEDLENRSLAFIVYFDQELEMQDVHAEPSGYRDPSRHGSRLEAPVLQ